jgi:tRNA A37 threonylcarbamoyladenosine modification protein TsaB
MRTLIIRAQDIRFSDLALAEGDKIVHEKHLDIAPENLLKATAETLMDWQIPLSSVKRLAVVTGPGSCTASRVSVTVANALAFALALPILSLQADPQESLTALWERGRQGEEKAFAIPSYASKPHITSPHS